MLRGIVFSTVLALAASCSVTAYQPTQQGQTAGSGTATQTTPTPAPTPTPTPTPPAAPTPPAPAPADMALPSTPDMTTTSAPDCATLSNCCADLQDPNDQQNCMDAVQNLQEGVCAAILQQLQDNGLCM